MSRPIVINSELTIPSDEFNFTFARSAGPGGQNVNKVNSKAILRWNIVSTDRLSWEVKNRFMQRFPNRMNQMGEVVLSSDLHREQRKNILACHEKLRQLILAVMEAPKPRKKTRPSRGSVQRRLQSKKFKSQRKQMRRYRPGADD